jgi:allantoate deiminase
MHGQRHPVLTLRMITKLNFLQEPWTIAGKGAKMINGERLWNRLFELAEIGKQEGGGVTRLSFTEEERAAKGLVASYMEEASLSVYEDTVGNLFGRREGIDPEATAILVGSHVVSVYLQRR